MRESSAWPTVVFLALTVSGSTLHAQSNEPPWPKGNPAALGMDVQLLDEARRYGASANGSGLVIYHDHIVASWGDLQRRYDLKSTTKSIGVTLLGLALADGLVKLHDPACRYHSDFGVPPESNRQKGWIEQITLFHLATHTAGFPKPGGYGALEFAPGTGWLYSDGGPNWLAECLTLVYGRDLRDVLFERVLERIGITTDAFTWRNNAYRPHTIQGVARREFGAGIHANVMAMARIGYLYLKQGRWHDQALLPAEFVAAVGRSQPELMGLPEAVPDYGNASDHYGLLWWNNADRTLAKVPTDAFWSWGLNDSLIVVVPSLDLVAVRAGESWPLSEKEHYAVLRPFLEPLCQAARESQRNALRGQSLPPYPYSDVFRGIQWADPSTIRRWAPGSDNWPVTAMSDRVLITAYGDGSGFAPFAPRKLSLGLAIVEGKPPELHGRNLPSPTLERTGDGPSGPKASGALMVQNVVYLLVRNVHNSQLVWSTDQGQTWNWAPWKFTVSFGCPTFVNFGPNYRHARDRFVYIVSPDALSAYEPAHRFILARVATHQILERDAYEFFAGMDEAGQPLWTPDIEQREAIFQNPGRCYRSGISYHRPSGRYLWYQVILNPQRVQEARPKFGIGVFEAPEPWGPWHTVYYEENWDVDPGESGCFPTTWMKEDGHGLHLLFSGNDSFSVRQLTLMPSSASDERPRAQ